MDKLIQFDVNATSNNRPNFAGSQIKMNGLQDGRLQKSSWCPRLGLESQWSDIDDDGRQSMVDCGRWGVLLKGREGGSSLGLPSENLEAAATLSPFGPDIGRRNPAGPSVVELTEVDAGSSLHGHVRPELHPHFPCCSREIECGAVWSIQMDAAVACGCNIVDLKVADA